MIADPEEVMAGWTQTVESKVIAALTATAESKLMAASTATAASRPMAALKRRVQLIRDQHHHWGFEREKVGSRVMADPKEVMAGWTEKVESKVMAASTATAASRPMAALKRRIQLIRDQ